MLTAAISAVVEPARQLGFPSLPRRLLDAVAPQRVGGRRAWVADGRAVIEVRGVNRPDHSGYITAVEQALEASPGVEWARVNAPLGRVVVALIGESGEPGDSARGAEDPAFRGPSLDDLVAVVNAVEEPPEGATVEPGVGPVDDLAIERAVLALAADAGGLLLAAAGRAMALGPLPAEIASAITAVDTVPRLRSVVEQGLGRLTADTTMALANAAAQGLAQGVVGLGLDVVYRLAVIVEANANSQSWQQHKAQYLATPQTAGSGPIVVERPRPLPGGPIESWANAAGVGTVSALAVAASRTENADRAAGLALAALPKPARLGREGFATQLGRILARRGAVLLDPAVLRRLDRISTVVLDAEILVTGQFMLGTVVPLPGADVEEISIRLHEMFSARDPRAVRRTAEWTLAPLDELPLRGRRGVRERQQLEAAAPASVLGLAQGQRLMAVAAVVPEPSESLEALAAACHRAGRRLVVAGDPAAVGTALADAVLPGGERLLGTVRSLQADGAGLLLLSRQASALANADVGVGVTGRSGSVPWGAHVLIGTDLALAALLIDGCGIAAAVSRRSVALNQAVTALGGVAASTGAAEQSPRRALLATNVGSGVALAQGSWAAIELGHRPLTPPISRVPWHAMPVEAVLDRLGTGTEGLAETEVRRRRRRTGQSTLAQTNLLSAVVEELSNPLTPILAGGAALSAAIGSVVDAGLVAGVSLLSAVVGGVQRRGTDRALAELLAGSAVTARVRRGGVERTVPAEELVPGDVLVLVPGDVIPADCRVVRAWDLEVDESSLTGEPFPVTKTEAPVIAATVADRTSMVYEGTTVAAGRTLVVVVATGTGTEAGRSMAATRVGAPPAGVEARLAQITRVTLPIAIGSAAAVVAAGALRGRAIRDTIGAGVSLAVASVPEGLPFLVSAAQLASARRLSREGALVRNPRTIEALGRVDVLGFDKTGTLTEGRIALAAVADLTSARPVSALTQPDREILAAGLRATPLPRPGQPLAHLTDRAVADAAADLDVTRALGPVDWRLFAALPFEPSRGFHATLGGTEEATLLSVKGAPEVVLPRCSSLRRAGSDRRLTATDRRRLTERVEEIAGQGYRVLTVAERADSPREDLEDADVTDLTVLGFLALSDPVRPAAGASIAALREAGVQIVMITGDHPSTAAAIARGLDLRGGGPVITGPQLDALDDAELDRVLPSVTVVARGTPAHKVRVVQAFQRLHRTVAMTGDGANDAPAIRLADVGIALGRRGTPAARAAADLVVADDRLETIISALVEGRAMWQSVRQALGILVGGNLGEIAFTVFGAALTGTSPLSTRQLLLVNLLTDLAPALAVALRPPQAESVESLLAEGPEASLGAALTHDVAARALVTAVGAAGAWLLATGIGYGPAQTVALTALVGTQLGQTVFVGGRAASVIRSSVASAAALAVVVQTPALSGFFGCSPLGPTGWAIAIGAAAAATMFSGVAPALLPMPTAAPALPAPAALPSGAQRGPAPAGSRTGSPSRMAGFVRTSGGQGAPAAAAAGDPAAGPGSATGRPARRHHPRRPRHSGGPRLREDRGHAGGHRSLHAAAADGGVRGVRLLPPPRRGGRLRNRGDPGRRARGRRRRRLLPLRRPGRPRRPDRRRPAAAGPAGPARLSGELPVAHRTDRLPDRRRYLGGGRSAERDARRTESGGTGTIGKLVSTAESSRHANLATVGVSLAVIVVVLGVRRIIRRVPGALLAVVAAIVVSRTGALTRRGVRVLGAVPRGLPHLGLPPLGWHTAAPLLGTAVSMFVVILAQSSATSRAYAARHDETFSENTDLVGLGLANAAAAVTGTFVVNGSPTKTQMVDSAGGRSQVATLTTSAVVLVVLLFLTGPLAALPLAVLATIVFLIGVELVDVAGMRRILAVRRDEFVVALLTAAAVVLLGVEQGIVFAIVASVIDHLRHSYAPPSSVLVPAGDGHWRSVPPAPGRRTADGLVIYRFGSSLYYANAHRLLEGATALRSDGAPLRWFCLDGAAISDVDFTAADALRRLHGLLDAGKVRLVLSEVSDPVRAQLDRYGVSSLVGNEGFFPLPVDVLHSFQSDQRTPSARSMGSIAK